MASPKAKGRMISNHISDSSDFAELSPPAAVLFIMLIPYFDSHGKINGGPGFIKDEVCPLIDYFDYKNIPSYLKEINDKTNVKWFFCEGRYWIQHEKFKTDPILNSRRLVGSVWEKIKMIVFKRDGYKCLRCGVNTKLECDHIIPIKHGGSNEVENLQTLCCGCNRRKAAKLEEIQ